MSDKQQPKNTQTEFAYPHLPQTAGSMISPMNNINIINNYNNVYNTPPLSDLVMQAQAQPLFSIPQSSPITQQSLYYTSGQTMAPPPPISAFEQPELAAPSTSTTAPTNKFSPLTPTQANKGSSTFMDSILETPKSQYSASHLDMMSPASAIIPSPSVGKDNFEQQADDHIFRELQLQLQASNNDMSFLYRPGLVPQYDQMRQQAQQQQQQPAQRQVPNSYAPAFSQATPHQQQQLILQQQLMQQQQQHMQNLAQQQYLQQQQQQAQCFNSTNIMINQNSQQIRINQGYDLARNQAHLQVDLEEILKGDPTLDALLDFDDDDDEDIKRAEEEILSFVNMDLSDHKKAAAPINRIKTEPTDEIVGLGIFDAKRHNSNTSILSDTKKIGKKAKPRLTKQKSLQQLPAPSARRASNPKALRKARSTVSLTSQQQMLQHQAQQQHQMQQMAWSSSIVAQPGAQLKVKSYSGRRLSFDDCSSTLDFHTGPNASVKLVHKPVAPASPKKFSFVIESSSKLAKKFASAHNNTNNINGNIGSSFKKLAVSSSATTSASSSPTEQDEDQKFTPTSSLKATPSDKSKEDTSSSASNNYSEMQRGIIEFKVQMNSEKKK